MSVVFDFNASLNDVAPLSRIGFPFDLMRIEKSGLLMDVICVLFLLYSLLRSSFASVSFIFNASLIDFAPVSPILFPVDSMIMEKSGLFVNGICAVIFVFTTQIYFCYCCV